MSFRGLTDYSSYIIMQELVHQDKRKKYKLTIKYKATSQDKKSSGLSSKPRAGVDRKMKVKEKEKIQWAKLKKKKPWRAGAMPVWAGHLHGSPCCLRQHERSYGKKTV